MTAAVTYASTKDEFASLLSSVKIRPECVAAVDYMAKKLLKDIARYRAVEAKTGVPAVVVACINGRESSGSMDAFLGNGESIHRVTRLVPAGRGPWASFEDGAVEALSIDGLDKVGRANWTFELACYYWEKLNGEGYRLYHHESSPYLWGGTNQQQLGKYTADSHFDPATMDPQTGTVAVALRMIELNPTLALPREAAPKPVVVGKPTIAVAGGAAGGLAAYQAGIPVWAIALAVVAGAALVLVIQHFTKKAKTP